MTRICNILVVEDDDSVRALLGEVLDHAGYEFALVRDGAEMRAALNKDAFDVAIIDISLRGGEDGFTLGEAASEQGCRVILTTGDPERRIRLEASGWRYLIKPFRMKHLTDLVDEILRDDAALCMRRPPATSAFSALEYGLSSTSLRPNLHAGKRAEIFIDLRHLARLSGGG